MQELVGKLSALDPEASESLKVIGFFDTLVSGQASLTALARSAAVLAGVPAGTVAGASRRIVRALPVGPHSDQGDPAGWPSLDIRDGVTVWIEREGASHANDAMLLERFAIAVSITISRANFDARDHRTAEIVVDPTVSVEERTAAAARLRLDLHNRIRAIALSADAPVPDGRVNGLISTPFGFARILLVDESFAEFGERAGVGTAVDYTRLPESWASALVALRLSDDTNKIVRADDLGPLILLAEVADTSADQHPDVVELSALASDRSALATLDALVDKGSIRGAASYLGLHHSSVQARVDGLTAKLGYDVRTTIGRNRYTLSRVVQRLHDARI